MEATPPKPLVLVLCTNHSARSQMAEAILRDRAGDRFDVASAGLEPRPIHPLTLRELDEVRLPTGNVRPNSLSFFLGLVSVRYDMIV
jgi:protein-tyrosine-phosphatase